MLRSLYGSVPADEVAKSFPGRSANSIVLHANNLGLSGYSPYHDYTEYELNFIAENYSSMSDFEIGRVLGRSASSIKNNRNKLGYHRCSEGTSYNDVGLYVRRHNEE